MRKQPPSSPPAVRERVNDKIVTQVREYKLITPLFGGGVNPLEADPVTIIRGSEIRAQLRFWWRACRGGRYKTVEDLKKAEDAIWGKAHKKDEEALKHDETVQIVVEMQFKFNSTSGVPEYAAFPLQPSNEERRLPGFPERTVWEGIIFKLIISFPAKLQIKSNQGGEQAKERDIRAEILAALWAWETFGGIGARTRRGFGALRCISVEENGNPGAPDLPRADRTQAIQWLIRKFGQHVIEGSWPKKFPHLSLQMQSRNRIKLVGRTNDPLEIWRYLIKKLGDFRQRRRGSNDPRKRGRSLWPEPSTIRTLTEQSCPGYAEPIPNPPVKKFPRAAFGLPIIFKFKDNDERYDPDRKDKDPRRTVLQLKDHERLASPLILKPLACQLENQREMYMGLAIILEGTDVNQLPLLLKTQKGQPETWEEGIKAALDAEDVLRLKNAGLQIGTDILQTFLQTL